MVSRQPSSQTVTVFNSLIGFQENTNNEQHFKEKTEKRDLNNLERLTAVS